MEDEIYTEVILAVYSYTKRSLSVSTIRKDGSRRRRTAFLIMVGSQRDGDGLKRTFRNMMFVYKIFYISSEIAKLVAVASETQLLTKINQ